MMLTCPLCSWNSLGLKPPPVGCLLGNTVKWILTSLIAVLIRAVMASKASFVLHHLKIFSCFKFVLTTMLC